MAKISVIGGGSWGTALAQLLSDNKHLVKLYSNESEVVAEINGYHTSNKYFPGVVLSELILATDNLEETVDFAEYILLAVPTKVVREVISKTNLYINKPKVFINAAKGIEPETFMRVSEIVEEVVPCQYVRGFVSLSGPSHAEEVIQRMLTTCVTASNDKLLAKEVQGIFYNNKYFRVYTSTDLIGVELAGSLKNIIALTSGIITGLGFGDNAKAALITRGLVEMQRIIKHFGGEAKTISGLTGVGDLIVTATSKHSRNFQAGHKIGSGANLKDALNSMTMVVEGARTCEAAYKYCKKHNIDIPLIEATYDVVFNYVEPLESISNLMKRDMKEE